MLHLGLYNAECDAVSSVACLMMYVQLREVLCVVMHPIDGV